MDSTPLAKYFEEVSEKVKVYGKQKGLTNDQLLKLYGLYKQAKEGDNTQSQPYFFQAEANAKWKAWTSEQGKTSEEAKQEYVEYALQFFPDDVKASYVA